MDTLVDIAQRHNFRTAQLKDYELYTSLHGRDLRAIAKEAVTRPIIGTASEIGLKFGRFFPDTSFIRVGDHDAGDVFIWALVADSFWHSLTPRRYIRLVPIGEV